jgi:hypothetical protein
VSVAAGLVEAWMQVAVADHFYESIAAVCDLDRLLGDGSRATVDAKVLPGSFVNVAIMIPATSYIEVPSGALVTRDKKPFVAVVDADSHIHYTPITVAGTDGKVVRVAAGLNEGTPVAVGPPASLADGGKITVQAPPPKPPEPAKPAEAPKPAPEVVKPVDASKPAATATKPSG